MLWWVPNSGGLGVLGAVQSAPGGVRGWHASETPWH